MTDVANPAAAATNNRPAAVEIAGEVVAGGVECPLFRTDDGREYTLDRLHEMKNAVGTRLRLRGYVARYSTCRQGTPFRVLERLD